MVQFVSERRLSIRDGHTVHYKTLVKIASSLYNSVLWLFIRKDYPALVGRDYSDIIFYQKQEGLLAGRELFE